ncbi:SIR2 family protein [Sinorhizobium sp. BG8]|uniref:SIR2 family protein n=1 Tax=Sinorhizobium sp. BG8 TaxID=2613773 RepID=UPI00193D4BD0|nr:SIR2 family protein [Sinorhizobium sp. BG8]QRM55739.1 SIR2 family protein [Sinorhizobium sp. BG8]
MIKWNPSLIDRIARRSVVILIGSGVSANSTDNNGYRPPTWHTFLQAAKAGLDTAPTHLTKAINQYRYLEACEYLKKIYDDQWIDLVKNDFQRPNYKPADIHQLIFDLDSRIVCSVNFDRIYDTFAITKSQGTYIVKNYWDDDIGAVTSGPERYLLKLHGSIDSPDKLIFSTSDYAGARNKYSAFYGILDALIATHSFLILGCGMNDPDVQLLFENYRYRYNLRNHFMCVPKPINEMQISLMKETRGINIIPYSSADGHIELTESLRALVSLVSDRRNEIADDQSW